MTDIVVTAAQVGRVYPDKDCVVSGILAAAVTAGQVLYLTTYGTWDLADAGAPDTAQCRGLALRSGGAGQSIEIMRYGWVYGFTLTGNAYDARLYLSDTAGAMADANGTVNVVVGRVDAMTDANKTKVVHFFGATPNLQYI